MTNTEDRARELLAAEFMADRYEDAALRVRQGKNLHPTDKAALRVITAALIPSQPSQEDVERIMGEVLAAVRLSYRLDGGAYVDPASKPRLIKVLAAALSRPPVEPIQEGMAEHDRQMRGEVGEKITEDLKDNARHVAKIRHKPLFGAAPSSTIEPSLQAGEMLADEMDRAGFTQTAYELRHPETAPPDGFRTAALRTIEKALSLPASGRDEILEEAAKIAELWVPSVAGRGSGPATANQACPAIAAAIRALKGQSLLASGGEGG